MLTDIVRGALDLAIFSCRNALFERGANFSVMILEFYMILFPNVFSYQIRPGGQCIF